MKLAVAAILAALFCCAPASANTLIHLHATNVQFYYDRFLLEADGDVHVTTSDGMTMTGDAFSMDLKLNRFVLAGHVHVENSAGSQNGAALADFLDFNRIYFVPITSEPDRWTFIAGDFAHPAKGREMPGDTFFFPDLGTSKPFIVTDSAVIGSRSFVRFNGNRIDLANGLGAYVPTTSYYVNFSNDQHLGDNSLAGANWDATWEFAGSAHSISALHARYDTVNKSYLSFEQHLSGKKSYAVFSVNPITRPSKFWDLVLYDKPSDTFQIKTFTQLHTFQSGLSSPLESGQYTNIGLTQALHHSYVQLGTTLTNFSLLPFTPLGYQGHGVVVRHPYSMELSAQTFSNRIGKTPFYELLSYNAGYTHDSYGLQTIGGVDYTTIWNHGVGLQLFMPHLVLGRDTFVTTKNWYLDASFQKNLNWNSTPHHSDTTTSSVTLSKAFDHHFNGFLGYSVQNVGDYYSNGLQSQFYPAWTPTVNGIAYPGYSAFTGVATFRTVSLDLTYANAGNFSAYILARKHDDFPNAIPNFFQTPPLDILGREIAGQNYLGEPPYDITADMRVRINSHTTIDLSRSYYFNFGNRRWSPVFVIQFGQ
jgi:hypothetical protein